jgi:catechol 2,3-dioxygenase-like lactoylglutathione lyase family enzyme
MSEDEIARPGRRVLHVCFCCDDHTDVIGLLVDQLGMRNTMTSPLEVESGEVLGFDRDVRNGAAFVFDARGPRTSPAVEVQTWADPPLVGTPKTDPTEIGIQAVGVAVPDPEATVDALRAGGATVIGQGQSLIGRGDTAPGRWTTLRHRSGLVVDVVAEDLDLPGPSRLRHLRATVTDLDASVPWYERLGFTVLDRTTIHDGSALGVTGEVDADVVRMCLPDEPFELVLVQWRSPSAHGAHFTEPNHAGLFRAAICVDDTRASHAAMAAAGTQFDRGPMVVPLPGTPVPDMWISFLSDPDRITMELVQRPRSTFR